MLFRSTGKLGNLGANNIEGRGTFNVDMSLARLFPVTERQKIEFRAEAFQILNHPILGQPSTTLSGTTFGRTTSSIGERIMQFALKYNF